MRTEVLFGHPLRSRLRRSAEAYATWFEFYEHQRNWLDLAVESALKALMYDAKLPEVYAALGIAYLNKGALDDSVMACRRAIALDADNFIGYWTLGRIDFALPFLTKA